MEFLSLIQKFTGTMPPAPVNNPATPEERS